MALTSGSRSLGGAAQASPILDATSLTVKRGRRTVLSDVSMHLESREVVHLGGANGSGKTSLLRVLSGVRAPRGGTLRVLGRRAYVPEKAILAPAMRCAEWLRAMRRLRGLAPLDWQAAAEYSGLDPAVLSRASATLSKAMMQRVALLEALHSRSRLLLLDEPFAGLDAQGREWLAREIDVRADEGMTVVLTEHAGVALQSVGVSRRLQLRGGRCEPADVSIPSREGTWTVTVRASHRDGRRLARSETNRSVDDLLRRLLEQGWHIDEVRD
jgi:ABC-type multidrug transport system ATPase subunit